MATLRLNTHVTAYDDLPSSNNPSRRAVDWGRVVSGVPADNPRSEELMLDGLAETTVFDGTRTLGVDGTTEFDLTASSLDTSRYRLKHSGTGTAPAFRTDRGLTLSGGTVTLVLNANSTVTMTHSGGAVFGAVVVGDTVLIPGTKTGDTALFDPLNEGEWTVLSNDGTTMVLARPSGVTFEGKSEGPVSITADEQVQAFSSAGVQVGDTLDITAGFSAATQRAYKIVAVAADYVEFTSTIALAVESGIVPGAGGIAIYSAAKRLVYVEADQEVALKLNGNTGETTRVAPLLTGGPDGTDVGVYLKIGTTFSLVVKNRSTSRAKVQFISAE